MTVLDPLLALALTDVLSKTGCHHGDCLVQLDDLVDVRLYKDFILSHSRHSTEVIYLLLVTLLNSRSQMVTLPVHRDKAKVRQAASKSHYAQLRNSSVYCLVCCDVNLICF